MKNERDIPTEAYDDDDSGIIYSTVGVSARPTIEILRYTFLWLFCFFNDGVSLAPICRRKKLHFFF